MNYVIVNGMCCCLSMCCKDVSEALYKIVGKTSFVKILYLCTYLLCFLVSIVFLAVMGSSWAWFLPNMAPGITCQDGDSYYIGCLTASGVYRVSMCLIVLTLFLAGVLATCTRVGTVLNEGLFFSKFVIVMCMFIGTLFIDNSFVMTFGKLATVFSYAFVICQSVILIDLAYLWGIKWAKKYSLGSRRYAILLILTTLIMFGLTGFFVVSSFTWHPKNLLWANIICVIQIVLMIGIQMLNFNKQNSLLTTSSLCLLVSYWTWSAGYSHPSTYDEFNETALYINMAVSIVLLLISAGGSIYGSSNN